MQRPPSDAFVDEIRELARLIALARAWVLRGPQAPLVSRVRRFPHAAAGDAARGSATPVA